MDVGVVLEDDERRDDDLGGDEEGGFVAVYEEICEHGEAARAKDGGERDVSSKHENDEEQSDGGESGPGGGDEEDSESGGDAFAATEPKPDREHVSENGDDCGDCFNLSRVKHGSELRGDQGCESNRGCSFDHVESEGGGAEAFAAGAEDVGGSDVSAADGADVLISEKSDQQIPDRDGPEQIRSQDEQTDCQEHDQTEFSRKFAVEIETEGGE